MQQRYTATAVGVLDYRVLATNRYADANVTEIAGRSRNPMSTGFGPKG
jgi:hypothetical protein